MPFDSKLVVYIKWYDILLALVTKLGLNGMFSLYIRFVFQKMQPYVLDTDFTDKPGAPFTNTD